MPHELITDIQTGCFNYYTKAYLILQTKFMQDSFRWKQQSSMKSYSWVTKALKINKKIRYRYDHIRYLHETTSIWPHPISTWNYFDMTTSDIYMKLNIHWHAYFEVTMLKNVPQEDSTLIHYLSSPSYMLSPSDCPWCYCPNNTR
jgi:hypothetical protein